MNRLTHSLACACCLMAGPAFAGSDFDIVNPDQGAFESVSKDLVAAYSYKALGPAEATGLTGFSIGGYATYLSVDSKDAWRSLTGDSVSGLAQAGLIVQKGLPFGIDVGAFYSSIPQASAQLFGAEIRYAILEGGVATPALAIRGGYTTATGIDDFDFSTYSLDATVSKGFAFVTPYAGVGYVWGRVDPDRSIALDREDVNQARFYAGVRVSFLLLGITPEYERSGSRDSFNLRVGFGF